MPITVAIRCAVAGFLDGWRQPYDLSTSTNVETLIGDYSWQAQEVLDSAINVGQLARAGRRSQTWVEGYWPTRQWPLSLLSRRGK